MGSRAVGFVWILTTASAVGLWQKPLYAQIAPSSVSQAAQSGFLKVDQSPTLLQVSTAVEPEVAPGIPLSSTAGSRSETMLIAQVPPLPQGQAPTWVVENAATSTPIWSTESAEAVAVGADQVSEPPSPEEVDKLIQQLDSYEKAPRAWQNPYLASPAITMTVPSGFGADNGRFFTGFGAGKTRINTTDGSASVGLGLGDARKSVGVQISYTAYSVSPKKFFKLLGINYPGTVRASNRPFGSGGFNLKIHRQFGNGWSAAIGADSIINIGGKAPTAFGEERFNELEGTYYGVVTKTVDLKADASEPFSRLVLTAGLGTGRFLSLKQATDGKFHINPFASASLKVSPAMNLITEWTGNDLAIGASIVPFRRLPLVLTPTIRDLLGPDANSGPRFVMGVGFSL